MPRLCVTQVSQRIHKTFEALLAEFDLEFFVFAEKTPTATLMMIQAATEYEVPSSTHLISREPSRQRLRKMTGTRIPLL